MIKYNDKVFEIDVSDVLSKKGIPVVSVSNDNLMIRCPFHGGGRENNPSMGVEKHTGLYNCFTCGAKGNVISWMNEEELLETQPVRQYINFVREEYVPLPKIELPDIYEISRREYSMSRGITIGVLNKFNVFEDDERVYFPIRDRYGRILDVGRRNKSTKAFDQMYGGVQKPLYGEFEHNSPFHRAIITEGYYDTLKLHSLGYTGGIGLLGLGSDYQIELINTSKFRQVYLMLDNDEAGRKATERLQHRITGRDVFKVNWSLVDKKDVAECTAGEIDELIFKAIKVSGI